MANQHRRLFLRHSIVALALGVLVSSWAPMAGGQSAGSAYTATADARLVSVDITTRPALIFEQLIDAGIAVSQSSLDSLGDSRAFASTPYPGATIVQLPDLLAGLTEGETSGLVPDYPLIVNSSYPLRPRDRKTVGTSTLEASSAPDSSDASASDGASSSFAETRFDAATASVEARAESTISSLRLSDQLRLDGVRSVAMVRKNAEGDVVRTSEFTFASITVLGQRIAVTPEQISLLGVDTPVGLGSSGLLGTLVELLAEDGTTLQYLPAEQTPDGIRSSALEITLVRDAPPELASGINELEVQIRVGGVSASVTNRAFGSSTETQVLEPTPARPVEAAPTQSGAGSPSAAVTSPSTPKEISTSPVAQAPASTQPLSFVASPLDGSIARFYPPLIIAAALMIGVATVVRNVGVRLR